MKSMNIKHDDLSNVHQRNQATFSVVQQLILGAYQSFEGFLMQAMHVPTLGLFGKYDKRSREWKEFSKARDNVLAAAREFDVARKALKGKLK